jgi:hypothetical protein
VKSTKVGDVLFQTFVQDTREPNASLLKLNLHGAHVAGVRLTVNHTKGQAPVAQSGSTLPRKRELPCNPRPAVHLLETTD